MKRLTILFAAFLAVTATLRAQTASITVDVDKPGITVSPTLYGIFFEEINRAGDGGIYAEKIQNRSFEDRDVNLAWSLVKGADADGAMSLDKSQALNANNPTSLRVEIKSGRVGVANHGFRHEPKGASEIAAEQGKAYSLSLYARGDVPVTVTLEKPDGAVLAKAEFNGVGAAWKKFDAELTASATAADARLVIAATKPGTVWLDMVSLFPKGQLFRTDLLKLLADMKPAFVRFPGGCYVEGNRLTEAFRWKKTIGDIAARPGHWNLWGYQSNDGLGYHEYLLLCEAVGAEPMYVINCGMSHEEQHGKPAPTGAALQEYVQDALDAIEYANGPADSKWGAVRAAAGHSAPFGMKMMEIGNENGGKVYNEHYALFYDAIKAKYPDIQLIANVWGGTPKSRGFDIIDEHYYNTPEFFMQQASRYDKYERKGPKIYVGEYAVTRGCGRGNLAGAIGEAAFMTGMERNADVVVMCSYAPLFEYVGWKHWNPNAILFDAARSYATPSWQVQMMFGRSRADVVLPTTVASPTFTSNASRSGMIGVGTWLTQAEYKDIQVTQGDKVLFEGKKGWKFVSGDWKWDGDVLRQTNKGTDHRAIAGKKEWKDYTLTLKARKTGGSEGFLVIFAAPNEREKSWWNIGGWGNKEHGLEIRGTEYDHVEGSVETGRWYDIKVELKGSLIRCYLDGKLIHEVTGKGIKSLYAVAGLKKDSNEIILKVVNAADKPVDAAIDLKGAAKLAPTGTATVLTSASGEDENSFEEPTKVAPKEETIRNVVPQFRHTFPANSVTVLRLKTAQ